MSAPQTLLNKIARQAGFPENGPAWFDARLHIATGNGIVERATGVALDETGEPISEAVRMARASAATQPAPKE